MGMTDEELAAKVTERQGAVAIREELQKEIDLVSDEIKAEMADRGVPRVETLDIPWIPMVVVSHRVTLNKTKLLSAGVTVAQIEAASEETEVVQLRVVQRGK